MITTSLHNNNSPSKDHDQTRLTVKQKLSHQKHKLKSKSQINIRKKHTFNQLNQELQNLKLKIDSSKDILATIYSKVKRKQAIYQNELSKSNLNIHRANKKAQDYKKMYEDGLRLVESCVQRNQKENLRKNQKLLSNNKLLQLKKNALQKIHEKRKAQEQQFESSQTHLQVDQSQINHDKFSLHQPKTKISQFNINQTKTKITQLNKEDKTPINKMKKSYSAINTRNKYTTSDKMKTNDPKQKNSISQTKIKQNVSFIKPQRSCYEVEEKQFPLQTRQKIAHSQIQTQKVDDKKTLYEIYKQRIEKRQKQQNSQKMSWIVDKLKQNIDDLQLIRKKSQIKLQKNEKPPINQPNNQSKSQKQQKKSVKELQIKRQTSKQRYLQIQKHKLKSINNSLL